MDASLALQRALHAALTGDAAVMAAVTGVYDAVPPGAVTPYLTIGADIVTDWSSKTAAGREHRFAVTVWDDAAGAARLKSVMGEVERVVAGMPGAMEGQALVGVRFLRGFVERGASGPGRGVVEFRARTVVG
jgi:Protein of unknown function (DUF3168)